MKTCHPCHYFSTKPLGSRRCVTQNLSANTWAASVSPAAWYDHLELDETLTFSPQTVHPLLLSGNRANVCSNSVENSSEHNLSLVSLFKVTANCSLECVTVLGTRLSTVQEHFIQHCFIATALWGGIYYYLHFTDEMSAALRLSNLPSK